MNYKDLIYINLVPLNEQQAFGQKVIEVANQLGINPNWLMQVMKAESGIRANAVNPTGSATGLIQFMPATARGLGTTTEALKSMSRVQQLDWVKKYFQPYKSKIKSYYDLYLVTFFPIAVGKPDSWVFQTSNLSASLIARQNPAINKWPKDDKITIAEFKKYLESTVDKNYFSLVFGSATSRGGLSMMLIFATLVIGYYLYNN